MSLSEARDFISSRCSKSLARIGSEVGESESLSPDRDGFED